MSNNNDVEDCVVHFGEGDREETIAWVRPAIRRQNRFFILAMVLLLIGVVAYAVAGTYYQVPLGSLDDIDQYDAEGGAVSDEAANQKMQEAINKIKSKHGNGAHNWATGHSPLNGYHNQNPLVVPDWVHQKKQNLSDHAKGFHTRPTTNFSFPKHNPTNATRGKPPIHAYLSNSSNHIPSLHDVKSQLNLTKATTTLQGHTGGNAPLTITPHGSASSSNTTIADSFHATNSIHESSAAPSGAPLGRRRTNAQPDVPADSTDCDTYLSGWLDSTVALSDRKMFEVVNQIPHDSGAFTQGLTYADGVLYESTGLFGQSSVRILDPVDGSVLQLVRMSSEFFGEGMTYYNGNLVQITWRSRRGFVYNPNDLAATPIEYTYRTTKNDEGWGITYDDDRDELIVTDGSGNLVFWDPQCWETGLCEIKRSISVQRLDGSTAFNLNEIEYWRGRVVANVWLTDIILVINPVTGLVEKEYDFAELWPKPRPPGTNVLNGISVSANPDLLYITGKRWNRMFLVRLWA